MQTRRTRAKPLSAEDRRAAIVAATRPLLIEHGGNVTTRLIAEAAGIAEGTIFRVFADKRELFWAVAEETINPPGGGEAMARELADLPDLDSKVRHVVGRLAKRTQEALMVMMAVRSALMKEPVERPSGPPTFLLEANKQLVENLTVLLFEPHADELRLPPRQAARVLRALTIGTWMPGLSRSEQPLSSDEIVDVVLNGVRKKES
ncbi:helix-turn-helix domain-containing protein [Nocardioides sp. KR10-350]|uniref:TetR/AcrR family transcriptional regulator n=1 Tax=Nocardioides cheoyonin TaxID=3156615 RepID=UPI0032B3B91F